VDKLERLYALHRLLDGRHSALSLADIGERLECSPATVKRAIRELRTLIDAPLRYDAALGGYRYAPEEGASRVELPGLWFGAEELAALVTLREVLARLEPGLLNEILAPLGRKLEQLITRRRLGLTEAARRVRVLSQHAREPGVAFGPAARAVLSRRMLAFRYRRRADESATDRRVSPQRLTRYRGSWYLDAWCHDREGLRSFAVERISDARVLPDRAVDRSEAELDAHYADAYGIFAGPATHTAVLRIAPRRARWVADETWHPRQTGALSEDGSYELRVPYGHPDELIQDILRLGPDAEVLAPADLRRDVAKRLRMAGALYGEAASADGPPPVGGGRAAAGRPARRPRPAPTPLPKRTKKTEQGQDLSHRGGREESRIWEGR
jgi:predicted DNA-binding transcriptional regulator YafY